MKTLQKEMVFITGNKFKFQVALKLLKGSGFKLVQKKLNVPEIQLDGYAFYSQRAHKTAI